MPRSLALLLTLLAAFCVSPAAVAAPQDQAGDPAEVSEEAKGLDRARARWESLTPEQRQELERRFERLRGLDAEQRRELERRHRSLREAEDRALEEVPEAVRAELDGLPEPERRQLVRELAKDALVERGRKAHGMLPQDVRDRLEGASPAERREILAELRRANRGDRLERAADKLARELELPEDQRQRLDELPPERREDRLFELHARRMRKRAERDGLPEWVRPDEWEGWSELEPRELHRRLERRSRERGGGSVVEAFGRRRGQRGPGGPGGPGAGRRSEEATGEPEAGVDSGSVAEGSAGERRGPLGRRGPGTELGPLMRPDPGWRLELRGMSPEERRAEIGRRIRGRVLEHLAARPDLLEPSELERLRKLEGEDFDRAVRDLIAQNGGRRGPGGPGAGRGLRRGDDDASGRPAGPRAGPDDARPEGGGARPGRGRPDGAGGAGGTGGRPGGRGPRGGDRPQRSRGA